MDEEIKAGGAMEETLAGGGIPEPAGPIPVAPSAASAQEGFPEMPGAAGMPVAPSAASAQEGFPEMPGAAGIPVAPPAASVQEGFPEMPGAAEMPVAPSAASLPAGSGTDAGEAAALPAKGKNTKRKVLGCFEMLVAVGVAVFGVWMFWQTRGTRLLYVDVVFGRICRYYWIAFIGALVFFAVGLYTLKSAGKSAGKRSRKEVEKDGKLE